MTLSLSLSLSFSLSLSRSLSPDAHFWANGMAPSNSRQSRLPFLVEGIPISFFGQRLPHSLVDHTTTFPIRPDTLFLLQLLMSILSNMTVHKEKSTSSVDAIGGCFPGLRAIDRRGRQSVKPKRIPVCCLDIAFLPCAHYLCVKKMYNL